MTQPANGTPEARAGAASIRGHALVVDDDDAVLRAIERTLRTVGIEVTRARTGQEAIRLLSLEVAAFDALVVDVHLPDMLGTDIVTHSRLAWPNLPVVLMSGVAGEAARLGREKGAYDFVTKPFHPPAILLGALERALEKTRLVRHALALEAVVGSGRDRELVGSSPAFLHAMAVVDALAKSDSTALILGESGTGKELVARAIHDRSARRAKPFVALNCGAFTASLVDSELFGHVRGAFTGAVNGHAGVFEQAAGGTIFLDEIGELEAATQVRLLRVLEDRNVRPVGSRTEVPIDVRVVAATHRDLDAAVAQGKFRQDLFYRLNVISVTLPPLRERRADIPALVTHLLAKKSRRAGHAPPAVTPALLDVLTAYEWPGNVRELENALERCMVLSAGKALDTYMLPETLRATSASAAGAAGQSAYDGTFVEAVTAFQRAYLEHAMGQAQGGVSEASRRTGIDRANLRRMLRRHGLLPSMGDHHPARPKSE